MFIVLSVWGFGRFLMDERESIMADLEALRVALSRPALRKRDALLISEEPYLCLLGPPDPVSPHTKIESLRVFFDRMAVLPDYLRFRRFIDVWLKRGGVNVRLKQLYTEEECQHSFTGRFSGVFRKIPSKDPRISRLSDLQRFLQPPNGDRKANDARNGRHGRLSWNLSACIRHT